MNSRTVTCPQYISKIAYISLLWMFQCMYVSIYYNYYILTTSLVGLTCTSLLFWSDNSNNTVRYIDMIVSTTTLGIKSYIAITDFAILYKYVWFISLSVLVLSFWMNRTFVEYTIFAKYSNLYINDDRLSYQQYTHHSMMEYSPDIIRMYYISTYIHMFFTHFLPTVSFSMCVIMTNGGIESWGEVSL